MRSLKALLIGGLVTASFANFAGAYADDWTYLECSTSDQIYGGGVMRFSDAPAVELYSPQSGNWSDACSGSFRCDVTSTAISFQNEHYSREINRYTGSHYFLNKNTETGLSGECRITDPPPPPQRQF